METRYWLVVHGLFSVRDDGFIEYSSEYTQDKAKKEFDRQFNKIWNCHEVDKGPAIQGHVISVIHDIREKEEL